MRAIYLPENLSVGEKLLIHGEKAHHFFNVLRIKTGEKVLILSGDGCKSIVEIKNITKKEMEILCLEQSYVELPELKIDLAISKLKKEAMDAVIKSCCEMGIGNIFIVDSEFSQKYPIKESRIEKLLISGIEQSNNAFIPKVIETEISKLPYKSYSKIFQFSTEKSTSSKITQNLCGRVLIMIGAEGGYGVNELKFLESYKNLDRINLDIPIMRAPTAFNCAVGYLHGLSCSID